MSFGAKLGQILPNCLCSLTVIELYNYSWNGGPTRLVREVQHRLEFFVDGYTTTDSNSFIHDEFLSRTKE